MKMTKLLAAMGLLISMQSVLFAQIEQEKQTKQEQVTQINREVIGYSVSDANQNLYRINLSTGEASNLGNVGTSQELEGLASVNGTLFGVSESNYGFDEGQLFNITAAPGVPVGGIFRREGTEAGAAYNRMTGILYNLQADDETTANIRSWLYKIDIETGAPTFVGSSRVYADGLAIDSRGRAFASDFRLSDALYRVNLAIGKLSFVGFLGLGDVNFDSGLAFDREDVLWALAENGAIYTLNTQTGRATFRAFVTENGVRVPGDLEGLDIP